MNASHTVGMLYVFWVCFMFSVVICTTVIYHSIYNFQVMYIYYNILNTKQPLKRLN